MPDNTDVMISAEMIEVIVYCHYWCQMTILLYVTPRIRNAA